jgi:hypothetical protein
VWHFHTLYIPRTRAVQLSFFLHLQRCRKQFWCG